MDATRDEFYRRVAAAFEELERAAQAGTISVYGVSSNTFPAPADNAGHVSLPRVLRCAEAAAEAVHGDASAHRFAVAQLPVNLYEAGAFTEDHGGPRESFLDVARANDIAVLANRPLNAVVGARLVRLAQYSHDEDAGDPLELAEEYKDFMDLMPWLSVFGGCCGSDLRHVREIALAVSEPESQSR